MQDEVIDAALRKAPDVQVPPHFANRVLANLPSSPPDRADAWLFPALTLAGTATLASLAWAAFALGIDRWLARPQVLATILAAEAAGSILWVWRSYRSAR